MLLSLLATASSPLSPPLPPALETLPSSDSDHHHPPSSNSLLIIAAILVFVFVASAAIHLLLHFLSRPSSSSSSSSSSSLSPSDHDCSGLIDSLPPFCLAVGAPESSLDCAVCLSRLRPDDDLRLLPACHHAFHSPCIASWIRSNPSCPLCRSDILLPPPPLPPPLPSDASATAIRRDDHPAPAPPLPARPSSLGPSVEQQERAKAEAAAPVQAETAEPAGAAGRGWLKEYVDRLASSASSSFSSVRFSSMGGGGGESWDLEGDAETSGGGGRSASYRWSIRAHS